ncbi:MAG TPA: hypothetical protein VLH84_03355 [Patescibacteria group bacterium]|nr:hypothetical protein [Patescibacteria group bacterium]
MAITKLHLGCALPDPFVCAVCGVKLSLDKATAGPFDGRASQTFICVSHLSEPEKLITGLADLIGRERKRPMDSMWGEPVYPTKRMTTMYGLIREEHSFGANPGTKDLARHLFMRMSCGKVVVVASKPSATLSALRKQWIKLERKVRREAASTLNVIRIIELNELSGRMQMLRFTTKWPDDYLADVYVATIEQLLHWAPECKTIYVTCNVELESLHVITSLLPRGALAVRCALG